MSNLLLGFPNRIDAATLSGGSWTTALPLANLQSRSLAVVARSTDAANASTKILFDLAAARPVRVCALANHNLSQAAKIKLSIGTTLAGNDVYAGSWVDAFSIAFGTGDDEWQDYAWWDPIAASEYIGNPYLVSAVIPTVQTGRYAMLEIDDDGNADGFVQIGRAFIGSGYSPPYGASYGLTDGWDDRSDVVELESGSEVATVRRRKRTVRLTLDALTQASDMGLAYEMMRRQGTTGEVLYIPSAVDPVSTQRTGFLGRLKSLNPVAYPSFQRRSVSFELVERI